MTSELISFQDSCSRNENTDVNLYEMKVNNIFNLCDIDNNFNDNLICKSTLMKRGWSKSMIKESGIKPEKEVDNPKSDNPKRRIKLYDRDKVTAIESGSWFKTRFELAEKRRIAAYKGLITQAQNKYKNSIDKIKTLDLQLPIMDSNYNLIKSAIDSMGEMILNGNETIEELITCYIRQVYNKKEYNHSLYKILENNGVGYANSILNERIKNAVHEKYFAN